MPDIKRVRKEIALSAEVIASIDEIGRRFSNKEPADPSGKYSIPQLRESLFPIREGLKQVQLDLLRSIPGLNHLNVYRAAFWQANPKGAILKGHVWNSLLPVNDKTLGRIQMAFSTVDRVVYSEYVAYKVTDHARTFHIERLSDWFGEADNAEEFQAGIRQLPKGFHLSCVSGAGRVIENDVHKLSIQDVQHIKSTGLDCSYYFTVARFYPFSDVADLTVDELGELLISDSVHLKGLYSLLQGEVSRITPQRHWTYSRKLIKKGFDTKPAASSSFKPEYSGLRKYRVKGQITTHQLHASTVNALCKMLVKFGLNPGNDQQRDLFIKGMKGAVEVLFEVKSSTTTTSIYTGVGQLLIHGTAEAKQPRKILVLPDLPTGTTMNVLTDLGIEVLCYERAKRAISFPGIEELLSVN
ncbi:hypothetical protein ACFL39_00640 [Gemmatimonadota bacterium]